MRIVMVVLCMMMFQNIVGMDKFKRFVFDIQRTCNPDLEGELLERSLEDGAPAVRIARYYSLRGDCPFFVGHGSCDWDARNKINAQLLEAAHDDATGVAMSCLATSLMQHVATEHVDYKMLHDFLVRHRLQHLMKPPVRNGKATLLSAVVQKKAQQSEEDRKKGALLSYIVRYGTIDELRYVLEKGVDPNEVSPDGLSPLMAATHRIANDEQGPAKFKMLLAYGADVNFVTPHRHTPLVDAAHYAGTDHEWVIGELLERGADPKVTPVHGRGVAWHVAGKSDAWLSIVMAMGAYAGPDTFYKRTPAWQAARHGATQHVKMLHDLGCSVDESDAFRQTPLQAAQRQGHAQTAALIEELTSEN